MHILLYVPDNQVSRNFIPHLWPFVLKTLTPEGHHVTILDGNARPHCPESVSDYVRANRVDLVGMGFMTRMAQVAYRTGSAIRARTGVPVVMGGPHVTEVPDEPLGGMGVPQCADAVVRGEADDLWPVVLRDAEQGRLQPIYQPCIIDGRDVKPSLKDYAIVPWDELDLSDFNFMRFVPDWARQLFRRLGYPFEALYVVPIESGRGCPYGCDFCTVTGFFGDKIRFRDNDNVIAELRRLEALSKRDKAFVLACFIDDNFAINVKRTKSLLRDMIRQNVRLYWFGQVSMNLLRDDELVELMAESGARALLVGLESVNTDSLKASNKSFNRPAEYDAILRRLARNKIFAITSFIFGLEADRAGVAAETLEVIRSWPPCLPLFGVLTPYPGTPLYERLAREGRLTRPRHWLDFESFRATYVPKHMSPDEVEAEVRQAWQSSYEPAAFRAAQQWLVDNNRPFMQQLTHFTVRLFFRGIYFKQMTRGDWASVLVRNVPTMASLARASWRERSSRRAGGVQESYSFRHSGQEE
jgi:radical SAM superfamily enzyme YgiQ (UPF0313 family)